MHADSLRSQADARAHELPGSSCSQPFGPDVDVYKVQGKMFMLLGDATGEPTVTLKARPEDSRVLQEAYADIVPGYHMNKKHWITVHPGGSVDPGLLDDLITESYLLVIEKLPKRLWPVDPATFHRGEAQ